MKKLKNQYTILNYQWEKIMIDFINEYYSATEYFYIFMINRVETYTNKKGKEVPKTREYLHNKKTFNDYYEKFVKMNKSYNWDFYMSVNTFKEDCSNRWNINVDSYKSLFFDIDYNGKEISKRIIKELGKPTYFIKTSQEKYQLIYELETPLKGTYEDYKGYGLILEKLTKYFKSDNTHDLARVGRLSGSINNKKGNGFNTFFKKFKYKYTIEHFEKYIAGNNIELPQPTKVVRQRKKKKENKETDIKIDMYDYIDYDKYKKIYSKILNYSNHNDLSRIDYTFIRRIRNELEEDYENILSVLSYCRDNLMIKHGHEIERYITLKIES